jgi:hypothetical protein
MTGRPYTTSGIAALGEINSVNIFT